MPNIKSAIKRVKVTEAKTLRNRMVKTSVRSAVKKFEAAVATGDATIASNQLRQTIASIDKAASKGILHKKTASRKKSRLSRRLGQLQKQA